MSVLLHTCMPVSVAENRTLLNGQDVERALVELLSVADASVKTATCHAVAAMSLRQASKDTFRDLGKTFTHSHTTALNSTNKKCK